MSYCVFADVAADRGLTGVTDQALINAKIANAQNIIDTLTGRTFECSTDTIRHFTYGIDTANYDLYFNRDLCAITKVLTNLDNGSGGDEIHSTQYITIPRDETPYYGIHILPSSGKNWTFTSDRESCASIQGKWAYSVNPPYAIVQACIRLTIYLYTIKDAQIFDALAMVGSGVITIPKGFPKDVWDVLEYFRKTTP